MQRHPPADGGADLVRTYIDRGGTFTDVVTVDARGEATLRKVRSDEAIAGDLARGTLTIGTTVATNALLTRSGAPTLLVVTRGFADLARIRDMTRPELFDPDATWPAPLCARVLEVDGRLAADGTELEPLALPPDLDLDGIGAVAIALLHSPRNPAHERAVAAWVRARGEVFVALGHEVCPQVGYLARIETTLVEAAITPVLRRSMRADRVPPGTRAIRSDGSWCAAEALGAADAVLSGPATGALATAAVARLAGEPLAIGLDMGGTSTDVCLVGPGGVRLRDGDVTVAGVTIRRPMVEVDTIGTGGGSVLWTDGAQLGVGPASAGADPGPQCYGRGGPPTVTDAVLATGGLDPGAFVPPLDPARVALPAPAEDFLAIARAQMADAIRRLAAQRGLDPAEHALVAFGGAAGQHAAFVAARLGIRRVWFHPAAAGLCAWGQALARAEEHAAESWWAPFPAPVDALARAFAALEARLPALGEVERTVALRHVGTDHALAVAAGDLGADALRAAFLTAHRARFGFDRPHGLEIVELRVRVRAPASALPTMAADPYGVGERVVAGPQRLDGPGTSVIVPPGWTARMDRGLLRVEQQASAPQALPSARTATGIALWSSRFQAVAAQAGAILERTARSVNIRERRDFSCAIFDADGWLVANAPHVPVHLGAMGETVRDLIRTVPDLADGQHWLCNDPAAGGSHLPDLTVVHPVRWDGVRLWVACRAHHADVGGSTPGSMPPRSARLADEGFVVRHLPLLADGQLRADLGARLAESRQLEVVLADLEAQIAANVAAARWLRELGPGPLVAAWCGHLLDVAEESVGAVLARVEAGAAEDEIGGVPLRVQLATRDDRLEVDFGGTGGPHAGNLNAPSAVVRAAVLYALRLVAGQPLPLNEGVLRRVVLRLPSPSILAPPAGAAIAGGNVETSQRIVDLVLRALAYSAASAGTMSNLTLGGASFTFYETIGAGQGGSPRGPGASGRQIHMTNTRATDPEVLEHRLPLRVRRFALRAGTGGAGEHPGGDGIVREIEACVPATAALLATRRDQGAPGLGGGAGAPGADRVRLDGQWRPWDGAPIALAAGDRVEIGTPGGGGWSR